MEVQAPSPLALRLARWTSTGTQDRGSFCTTRPGVSDAIRPASDRQRLHAVGRALPPQNQQGQQSVGSVDVQVGVPFFGLAACALVASTRAGQRRRTRGVSVWRRGKVMRKVASALQEPPAKAKGSASKGLPLFCKAVAFSSAFECTVCKKRFKSRWDLDMHVASKQHLARVRERQLLAASLDMQLAKGSSQRESSEVRTMPRRVLQGEELPDFIERVQPTGGAVVHSYKCTLCENKTFSNFEQVLEHVASKRHLRNVRKFTGSVEEEGEEGPRPKMSTAFENPLRRAKVARRRENVAFAVSMLREAAAASGGGATETLQGVMDELPKLLRVAAVIADVAHYVEVLVLFSELEATLDNQAFADVLELLTVRIKPSPALVRLTLNLAVPSGGAPVPVFPQAPSEGEDPLEERLTHEVEERIRGFSLSSLFGRVLIPDAEKSAPFAADIVQLHVEYIDHIRDVRRRLAQPCDVLERQGFMLRDLTLEEEPGPQGRLSFALQPTAHVGQMQMRVGDQVIVSRDGPLAAGEHWLASVAELPESLDVEQDLAPPRPEDGGIGLPQSSYDGPAPRGGYSCMVLDFDEADSEKLLSSGCEEGWRIDRAPNFASYRRRLKAILRDTEVQDDRLLSGRANAGHFSLS